LIRFKLTELLAAKAFREGRRIEWQEVAEQANIHRTTISRMLNVRGYNASSSNMDALCAYFDCQVGDLAEYVPDEQIEGDVKKSFRGPRAATRGEADASTKKGTNAASRKRLGE
jgi:putative transcriptional regulator